MTPALRSVTAGIAARTARNDFLETTRGERTQFYELFRRHSEQARFDLQRLTRVVRDPGLGFDVEGTPRRQVGIVERGVSRAILHTRRTAKAAGGDATSTGHAIEGGGPFGALGASAVVAAWSR